MLENVRRFLAVVLIAVAPIAVFAQDTDQETKEAFDKLDQMSVEVNKFVGDVRFDEGDVESLIDLWEEYTEFGDNEYEPDDDIDFESIIADDRLCAVSSLFKDVGDLILGKSASLHGGLLAVILPENSNFSLYQKRGSLRRLHTEAEYTNASEL